jgi:HEAT repeat protein
VKHWWEKRKIREPKETNKNLKTIMQYLPATAEPLIKDLGDKNITLRTKAHHSLVIIGEPAVKPLVVALSSPNRRLRWEAGKVLDEININWTRQADEGTIAALITDLDSPDGFIRLRARWYLTTIGRRAIPHLGKALDNKDTVMRWEAAKALEQIGDPQAIEVLIDALEDNMFDVRWMAAEGLIIIGRPAIRRLLKKLIEHPDSEWLREGAHHIIRCLKNPGLRLTLQSLLRALEDLEAPLEVPLAAEKALNSLNEKEP